MKWPCGLVFQSCQHMFVWFFLSFVFSDLVALGSLRQPLTLLGHKPFIFSNWCLLAKLIQAFLSTCLSLVACVCCFWFPEGLLFALSGRLHLHLNLQCVTRGR